MSIALTHMEHMVSLKKITWTQGLVWSGLVIAVRVIL